MAKKESTTKKTKPKKKGVLYSKEIADKILERLYHGETLTKICKDAKMPYASSVLKWTSKYEAFGEQYADARVSQVHLMYDEILDIVDEHENSKDFHKRQHSRLRIDTRKWFLSKVVPKMPKLAGGYLKQIDQIICALHKKEIPCDIASLLCSLIQSKAVLAPSDDYKSDLDELKKKLDKK